MSNTANDPLIGAHMSISGGVDKAIIRGASAGCRAVQIFTKSSNQWAAKELDAEVVAGFKTRMTETGIKDVVAHDSYLINLASPDNDLREKSFRAFLDEMDRCRVLGIRQLIMHPGSHTGQGEEEGLRTISAQFKKLLSMSEGWGVNIVLETTAGQGTNLGYSFEQLATIIENTGSSDRMKVCFDTCHVFAAGYDISTVDGYHETMEIFDRIIGLDRLVAFHINDSKKGLGSRVDRHEHLGQGEIGEVAFRMVMNDDRFKSIPKILETPKGKEMDEDRQNLAFLKKLLTKAPGN
ncbi:MAG: deoxyribonuclease IV [bacterium]|nr:deoxyribonuclease IV [bacterium]